MDLSEDDSTVDHKLNQLYTPPERLSMSHIRRGLNLVDSTLACLFAREEEQDVDPDQSSVYSVKACKLWKSETTFSHYQGNVTVAGTVRIDSHILRTIIDKRIHARVGASE